jgi:cyclic-di-AMP phosphodiesterase PgpH
MSVKNQLKLLVGGLGTRRADKNSAASSTFRDFLEKNQLVAAIIFILTVAAIVLISSVGMTTINLPVAPNELATVRVVAGSSFNYVSEEKTASARAQLLERVPPVFHLDTTPLTRFIQSEETILKQLNTFEETHAKESILSGAYQTQLDNLANQLNTTTQYRVSGEDLATILSSGDAQTRQELFQNGVEALKEIYAEGVHDSSLNATNSANTTIYQIAHPNGRVTSHPVESMEDALTFLRVSLSHEGVSRNASQALFRFFKNGITSNLVYDRKASEEQKQAALKELKPVSVQVTRGQVIIEAGERVTPEQYEMFRAEQEYQRTHGDAEQIAGLLLFGHILLVLAMVIASIIYIRLEDAETLRSNVRLGLLALVVILNLALVRIIYSLGSAEFFTRDGSWAATLPYTAPTALAPLIVAILIDTGSAIFMALLISIFTGVIYGNRLDLLVLTFLASMAAIYVCRDARRRGRVVNAGIAGGLTIAAFAALIGLAQQTPIGVIAREMTAGLLSGLLTGIAVVGFLPILESLFKRTTDITLLELTDYNHPLLRKMQLEAPGTYHHSLMVAQLSENACNAIGANPLLARVCALFHDIGKITKAGYFTENQRNRANPHDNLEPAVSAQIIREHVKEGVELAHKYKLPRAIVDVIQQHHGMTHVRYFYEKALAKKARSETTLNLSDNKTTEHKTRVDESLFRYDGPKPQFKECAVIFLADATEAASRSLRSATPEELSELIESIVNERIAEGQLNEVAITLEDIAKIKNSFTFTLLNVMHSRIAYNDKPSDTSKTAHTLSAKSSS